MTDEDSEPMTSVAPRQAFTLLQSRKFRVPTTKVPDEAFLCRFAKLCPSMDLILVKSTNSSSSSGSPSLVIYRSLSWQKVADIVLQEGLREVEGDTTRSGGNKHSLAYCWSPDGQSVAVAQEFNVSLYRVEGLVTASGAGGALSGNSTATWTISLQDATDDSVLSGVQALHWVHVGKNHPTAMSRSAEEEGREVAWRYQSHYVDQSTKFLPPSAYYSSYGSTEAGVGSISPVDDTESQSLAHGSLTECRTPLSVLCVSTNDSNHRLYLHGRYPLLTLPKSTALTTSESSIGLPTIVASNDLAYWLTTTPCNTSNQIVLTLYLTPFLKRDRYALQQIATLHTSITAHLRTIQRSVSIITDSWKTSLRPLDQKLRPLTTLLKNYGVDVDPTSESETSLPAVIKEYIMVGHVTHSTNVANAMDQFFTGVQMNDQLVQRMERSLLASMASVESTAIRTLLRPTQALGWQIQELGGLIQLFDTTSSEEGEAYCADADPLHPSKSELVHDLTDAVEKLWISVEHVMTSIVTGRMVVRDFCGWLRHAGSQVKARGTAPNSVQRENAKKRRVTQAVLEHLVTVLTNSINAENSRKQDSRQLLGLTELLLNLDVTEMLKPSSSTVGDASNAASGRAKSPSSVADLLFLQPHVSRSLQQTMDVTKLLFSNPLSNIPTQILSKDIFLPRTPETKICRVAVHSRIGRDSESLMFWSDEEETEDPGYFLPRINKGSIHYANLTHMHGLENCRQWFLIAQAHGETIQLFSIPLGWKENGGDDEFDYDVAANRDDDAGDIPFYLTSKLSLPPGGQVLRIGFYGDDGKSSLSSGIDSGTGVEKRQKIGFIYQKNIPSTTELWTLAYDSLSWQTVPFDSMLLSSSRIDPSCCTNVIPKSSIDDIRDGDEQEAIYADDRILSEGSANGDCDVLLCGSRGVGGVAMMSSDGVISMDILDLEDDEEEDEDDAYSY